VWNVNVLSFFGSLFQARRAATEKALSSNFDLYVAQWSHCGLRTGLPGTSAARVNTGLWGTLANGREVSYEPVIVVLPCHSELPSLSVIRW